MEACSTTKVTFHEATDFKEKVTTQKGQNFFDSLPFRNASIIWHAKVTTTTCNETMKTMADSGATLDMNGTDGTRRNLVEI